MLDIAVLCGDHGAHLMMASTKASALNRWTSRLDRCRELQSRLSSAESILIFYGKVLDFQARVAESTVASLDLDKPFREQVAALTRWSHLQDLVRIAKDYGPTLISERAERLQDGTEERFRSGIRTWLCDKGGIHEPADDFFFRTCMQPVAETLRVQKTIEAGQSSPRCPVCGSLPQLAVLRPEGEGGARSLECSLCLHEWQYRRIVCAWCGEEDKEKLPRFSAEQLSHVYISACETCQRYLKVIDMTIEGRAVPLVDEVASAVLDVWAAQQGYRKMVPNVMGL